MSRIRRTDSSSSRDYEVGFGRPPVVSRFKPGQSGNPRGQPKGPRSVGQLLAKALSARVSVKDHGRTRRMTMLEVIIQGIVNDAARRDPKALRLLLALINQFPASPDQKLAGETPDQADLAILGDYLMRYSEVAAADGAHSEEPGQRQGQPDGETER